MEAIKSEPFVITWLKAARAPFLTVSAIPAGIGGAVAYAHGRFDALLFVLVMTGVVMAQSAADFFDDYFDFKDGAVANKNRQFHDSPLFLGRVTVTQVLWAGVGCAAIAAAIGLYLYTLAGMPVVVLALAGAFFVIFYTAPPLRLNMRGLGEIVLFIGFGPAIVVGVYYVLTSTIAPEPLLAGIPVGLLTMNVGVVSNMFDVPDDRASGKKTLAVLVGQKRGLPLLTLVSALAYAVVIVCVALKLFPAGTLSVLLTLPLAWQTVRRTANYADPDGYLPAMSWAIATTSIAGILTIVGYLI
jgi:1,4-dihydroxy-2-naphthoate octaprenyltransferase